MEGFWAVTGVVALGGNDTFCPVLAGTGALTDVQIYGEKKYIMMRITIETLQLEVLWVTAPPGAPAGLR